MLTLYCVTFDITLTLLGFQVSQINQNQTVYATSKVWVDIEAEKMSSCMITEVQVLLVKGWH